jgi:general secretion pathway protein D
MRLVSRLLFIILCLACLDTSTAQHVATKQSSEPELISFHYAQEELVNVITYLATKKEINLLLPTKEDEKVTGKLTWSLEEKVTVDHAWDLLQTILAIAGYSIVPYPTHHQVIKTSPAMSRNPVPLYIGVSPDQLPATDEYVRYMYYLSNIKAGDQGGENEALTVLKNYLPSESEGTLLKLDETSNTLIIGARSNDIRAIMPIIQNLDRPGFQEKMEIIPLKYTEAKRIADLFNNQIFQSQDINRYRLDAKKAQESSFFSKHMKIVANERRNNVIVLGRPQAIDRTRNFIKNYLDVPQESGKSVLHTYRLQYLNAKNFAGVLESILLQKEGGGLDQAAGTKQQAVGPQRYFDEVIIAYDTPDTEGTASSYGGEEERREASYYGGNTLIIAARNDDWKRIEQLIGQLDQPSPQVLIEVLITDLTLDDTKALGAALRNPEKIPLAGNTAYQSAHLSPGIMPETFENNVADNTIGLITDDSGNVTSSTDLLRTFGTETIDNTTRRIDTGTNSIASLLTPGSTAVSMSDNSGKTWGIAQILKTIDHSKVLSHPHVVATNQKTAKIEISTIRKATGGVTGSAGSQVVIVQEDLKAALSVDITPRIALADDQENAVNLQVNISIDQFVSATNDTRTTRRLNTNVTMNTGDILSLGGLIRSTEQDAETKTPILSDIPVIGWLFKKRRKDKARTNLTVFISPTVILPRQRDDMLQYTKDYLNMSRHIAKEGGMFDSLKDPITRWFFGTDSETEKFTTEYLKNDVRFQDTPMPREPLSATKPIGKKDSDRTIIAQANEQEHDQLKNLFETVDNPFKELQVQAVVQNEQSNEHVAQKSEVSMRRKKRRR